MFFIILFYAPTCTRSSVKKGKPGGGAKCKLHDISA